MPLYAPNGEYISGSVAALPITTATHTNLTTISLPAGDWDVSAFHLGNFDSTTNCAVREQSISTASETPNYDLSAYTIERFSGGIVPGAGHSGISLGPYRISLAATTTVYYVARFFFSVSTLTVDAMIRARRVR